MISNQSLSKEWIMSVRETSQIHTDPILIEKMLLALILLDNLHNTGLDFIFKGGTCLLLVLGKPMRFSIDIDIVLETSKGLEEALQSIINQGIFLRFEEHQRSSNIPKCHYKFFYNSAIEGKEGSILLDVLFDENPYPAYQKVPIKSEFVIIEGIPAYIKCPVPECLLGDKLSAFAPHTSGILYGKDKELEIIKQLYDVGLLFDIVSNVNLVADTFYSVAAKELAYRGQNSLSSADVLTDSFNTACLIGMRGFGSATDFDELLSGIKKFSGFVYKEHFTLDSAILSAAKAAYMVKLIQKGAQEIARFIQGDDLSGLVIRDLRFTKLNKVKKTSPEAFYYFYQALDG